MPQVYDLATSRDSDLVFDIQYRNVLQREQIQSSESVVPTLNGTPINSTFYDIDWKDWDSISIRVTVHISEFKHLLHAGDRIGIETAYANDNYQELYDVSHWYFVTGIQFEGSPPVVPNPLIFTWNTSYIFKEINVDLGNFRVLLNEQDVFNPVAVQFSGDAFDDWECTVDTSDSYLPEIDDGDVVGIYCINKSIVADYCTIVDSTEYWQQIKESYGFIDTTKDKVNGESVLMKPQWVDYPITHNEIKFGISDPGYYPQASFIARNNISEDVHLEGTDHIQYLENRRISWNRNVPSKLTAMLWAGSSVQAVAFYMNVHGPDAIYLHGENIQKAMRLRWGYDTENKKNIIYPELLDYVNPNSNQYRSGLIDYGYDISSSSLPGRDPSLTEFNLYRTIRQDSLDEFGYRWRIEMNGLAPDTTYNILYDANPNFYQIFSSDSEGCAEFEMFSFGNESLTMPDIPPFAMIRCKIWKLSTIGIVNLEQPNGTWRVLGKDIRTDMNGKSEWIQITKKTYITFRRR